jgi:trans-aconitate 2-methyltransferase
MRMSDWQPDQYLRFEKERTQPTIDLVNRLEVESPRRIIDIGCGPGNSTVILRERWPDAHVVGLDSSHSMLEKAKAKYPGCEWRLMDAAGDLSSLGAFDVVFSNAALQWIPDHETLLPNLYAQLSPGGVLAVQAPFVRDLPVYAEILAATRSPKWSEFFAKLPEYPKHFPFSRYYDIICGLSPRLYGWQTDYLHIMPSHDDIVEWYKGSGLRPFLDLLPDDARRRDFCGEYRERIAAAYPVERDGKVILPFTRIFFLVYKR